MTDARDEPQRCDVSCPECGAEMFVYVRWPGEPQPLAVQHLNQGHRVGPKRPDPLADLDEWRLT